MKHVKCEADLIPSSSADVKNEWSCTLTPPCSVHRDTLQDQRKERVKWEAAFLAEQLNGLSVRN